MILKYIPITKIIRINLKQNAYQVTKKKKKKNNIQKPSIFQEFRVLRSIGFILHFFFFVCLESSQKFHRNRSFLVDLLTHFGIRSIINKSIFEPFANHRNFIEKKGKITSYNFDHFTHSISYDYN